MTVARWKAMAVARVLPLCADAAARCPTPTKAMEAMSTSGVVVASEAEVTPMGSGGGYCFLRYEYVWGSARRMTSRLLVFQGGNFLGFYPVGFIALHVRNDGIVLDLGDGVRADIPFRSIGKDVLVDGEIRGFAK